MFWSGWWDAMLELVFPGSHQCSFCWREIEGQKFRGICDDCRNNFLIQSRQWKTCPRCGHFTAINPCGNCYDWGDALSRVVSVAPNNGMYRELVYALKYSGRKELAVPLGSLMAWKVKETGLDAVQLVVPVPLHPCREMERGYNQSALLARQVARQLGLYCGEKVLKRQRHERSQTGLGRRDRKGNLRDAFALAGGNGVAGKRVLLVDDVITTGTTLLACAAILKQGGADKIYGVTWAAGAGKQES